MKNWQPISTAPCDSSYFLALGDEELAIVWWEPECGQRWKIRNIPGGAVRLGSDLSVHFHSWTRVSDLHKCLNLELNPSYYGVKS